MPAPEFWLIGGPNGAGKTTLVKTGCIPAHVSLLNPDALTLDLLRRQGIKSFEAAPPDVLLRTNLQAAEETFADLERRLSRDEAVCVETVLSTDKYKPLVEAVLARGGVFALIYVALREPGLSLRRVSARVRLGGHDVPADKLEQRWHRSLALLPWFASRADYFWVLDNSASNEGEPPALVANGGRGLVAFVQPEANPAVAQTLQGSPLFTRKIRLK